ncbi:MAG TPA: peptidylprolyl isomerase [Gemmatimonadales bacterium]|nr:peptidylprolyl isomerase [Gemmatimonadales bacterium]
MGRTKGLLLLLLSAGLSGCDGFRDLFSAHADIAAEAGSQQLSSERLAQIMSAGKGIKPSRETADFVSNIWVDYALFAQAAAEGKLPLDSAGIAQVVWPEMAELRGTHWHDTLSARRSNFSTAAADSVYKADQVRLLQHILFRVEPNAVPAVRDAARKKASNALARVKRGSDFGTLASQLSEDPGSRADRGFLPPSPKGKFVTAFDSAGWTLAPGAVSGVVETPFGYHIIKRPDVAGARERITAYLAQSAGTRLDSIYMDSLAVTNEIKVARGAAATMRKAGEDPDAARKSDKTLVSYKGGELTVRDFMRWVQALPPQYMAQLKQADDSMLTQFAKILTQNVLLLRQADSAGIDITPEEWQGLQERYRTQLDTLRAEMGLDDANLGDSSVAAAQRSKVAALKVEEYFDRLIGGKTRLRPIPSALATLLRERSGYEIHDSGLNRAVELAQASARQADSARAATGPLKPAPGPAPIPGVTPGAGGPQGTQAPQQGAPAPRTPTPAADSQPPGQGN